MSSVAGGTHPPRVENRSWIKKKKVKQTDGRLVALFQVIRSMELTGGSGSLC